MSPQEMRDARAIIGGRWDLGRPLRMTELGRLLGLQGRDVGATIRDWERGKSPITGPVRLAMRALLDGWRPDNWRSCLTRDGDLEP